LNLLNPRQVHGKPLGGLNPRRNYVHKIEKQIKRLK